MLFRPSLVRPTAQDQGRRVESHADRRAYGRCREHRRRASRRLGGSLRGSQGRTRPRLLIVSYQFLPDASHMGDFEDDR